MNTLPFIVFTIICVLIFFGLSVSCVVVWFKSFKKTKEILRSPNEHWSIKFVIYYGIYFTIFVVLSIFLSLVLAVAMLFWSGMHV